MWAWCLWQSLDSRGGASGFQVRIENMTDEAILVFANFIFGGTKEMRKGAREREMRDFVYRKHLVQARSNEGATASACRPGMPQVNQLD